MTEKNQRIEQYIKEVAAKIDSQYKGLITKGKIEQAIAMFKNSPEDFETQIVPKIDALAQQMIEDYIKFQQYMEEMNRQRGSQSELATLDLGTDLNGIYLSQQQVDLLMITDINSPGELKNYVENVCNQFPYRKVEDVVSNFNSISNREQLELAKKQLYKKYQDELIGYLENSQMSNTDKAKVKLKRLGVSGQELNKCLEQVSQGKIGETFKQLGQVHGSDFITHFNRSMNDDFENVKSVSYEEMKSLSNLIKGDSSIDTIIIATGKFDNSIYPGVNGKVFDPYLTSKGLDFCESNGKHMRYHALFDQAHVEKLIKQGKGKQDHDQILAEMKEYVKMSMDFIASNNRPMPDGTMLINEVEVFNELVEKNKTDKNSNYEMVWEKHFGITMPEIMSCFKGIQKPNGVEFMYNETTLTESPKKRAKVEKVLQQIDDINPHFIDRFGDQMHLSDEDVMTSSGKKNLTETAQMLKRVQDGKIIVDGKIKNITPKKVECTEHDFHFTKGFMENAKLVQANGGKVDTWMIKRGMQDVIGKTYTENGVKFERSTYWSLFGKNDHNLCRANIKIQQENVERKKQGLKKEPLLDTMSAGIIRDGKTFTRVKSLKSQKQVKQESFDVRSKQEINTANKIREKNQQIAQQKRIQKPIQKQQPVKTKVYVKNNANRNSNKGFTNSLALVLTVGFLILIIFVIVYIMAN